MKHTPGPWEIDSEDWRVINSPERDMVAVCEYVSCGDADLIAAAPDMLELLFEAVRAVEMGYDLTCIGWYGRTFALVEKLTQESEG